MQVFESIGPLMKTSTVVLAVLFALGCKQKPTVNGHRFAVALADYVSDLKDQGKPVPSSITLDQLVEGRFLGPEDARAFQGVRVVFHGDATETRPQSILLEAWLPDGMVCLLLADGSVQQMESEQYKLYKHETENFGQPGAAPNAAPPPR